MKYKRFVFEKSNKYIIEEHKPIIPTIIFWSKNVGTHSLTTFKFTFWKWWFKIGFYQSM